MPLSAASASVLLPAEVLTKLKVDATGLTTTEAQRRLAAVGPNAVRSHAVRWHVVLARQLRSPLLVLLALTSTASFLVREHRDAVIIAVILTASVALGFVNEFRAEKAAASLHSQLRHSCRAWRDGHSTSVDVTDLVPGDVVDLRIGQLVPADLRLIAATALACEESTLTGSRSPRRSRRLSSRPARQQQCGEDQRVARAAGSRTRGACRPRYAFRVLRAFLHTLRDRLPVEEAVHLAAQLPALLRGLYYEGWRPSETPAKYHDATTFLDHVAREAGLGGETEAAYGSEAAARVLARHVTEGELAKVRAVLPTDIATFLPVAGQLSAAPQG